MGVIHRMLCRVSMSHVSGVSIPSANPRANGPRKDGQLSWAIAVNAPPIKARVSAEKRMVRIFMAFPYRVSDASIPVQYRSAFRGASSVPRNILLTECSQLLLSNHDRKETGRWRSF